MPKYLVRVSMVEVYEIPVEAESVTDAIELVSDSDTDFSETCDRLDSYWLDIDEEMDVTELTETEGKIPTPAKPVIKPVEFVSSHRTHRLPSTLTSSDISTRLHMFPNLNPCDKVTKEWNFTVNGHECAIWDYKGIRWSAYDPDGVLSTVFPELVKG